MRIDVLLRWFNIVEQKLTRQIEERLGKGYSLSDGLKFVFSNSPICYTYDDTFSTTLFYGWIDIEEDISFSIRIPKVSENDAEWIVRKFAQKYNNSIRSRKSLT